MGQIIYSPGDKVVIKSIDWYNENKDELGHVKLQDETFVSDMAQYCGCEMTISEVSEYPNVYGYYLEEDKEHWGWTADMFE